jgi:hypothetical protein
MPAHATFLVTNARQVDLLIPAQEQLEISDHLANLLAAQAESERLEQAANSGFLQHHRPILEGLPQGRKGDPGAGGGFFWGIIPFDAPVIPAKSLP